jgi:hypothetical protein
MNHVTSKLRLPAVGLISLGALNILASIVLILGRLASLIKGEERVIVNDAERLGYEVSMVYFPLVSLISIAAAPIIMYGGVQMLSARKYSVALLAAILALMPFSSLCCVLGVPIGIWAIVVLRNPEVRAAFQNSQMPSQ